jgi:carboxylate-amine ligase
MLAAYAQSLARYLLLERPLTPLRDVYLLYSHNRFQACRYGLDGTLVDAYTQRHVGIRDDVLDMLKIITPHAHEVGAGAALNHLAEDVAARLDDAAWLREQFNNGGSLNDVARMQSELWMGNALASA